MSPTRRRLARTALVLVGSFLLLTIALVARLARGAIGVDFLRPHLERSLSAPDGSFRVHLPAIDLAWDRRERQLELRATSVRVVGQRGEAVAVVPAVSVRLARGALLRGRIAPAEVRLVRPELTVVRAADGTLDLGLSAGGPASDQRVELRAIVDDFAQGAGTGTTRTSLRRLSAQGAEITIVDRRSAQAWRLTGADLVLERDLPGLVGTLAGRLEVAPHSVSVRAAARYRPGREHGIVTLGFRRLHPEMLADLPLWSDDSAAQRTLASLRMPLDGTVAVTLDSTLRPIAARGHVRGGAGQVQVPGASDPIDVTGLRLRGRVDVPARHLEVQHLTLARGVSRVHVAGGLSWADGGMAVEARTSAERLPLDTLAQWWPPSAAPSTRRWVVEQRKGGVVTTAQLELAAAVEGGSRKVSVELRHGTANFDGVSVRYHEHLPPLTDVAGSVRLDDRGWTLRAGRGRLETLELAGASGVFPVGKGRASRPHLTALLRGPLSGAVAILDREPFGYARALGITPAAVGGTITADIAIDAPIAGSRRPVAVSGNVLLSEVATDNVFGRFPLTGGEISVDFDDGRVQASGVVRVAATPVSITWNQDSTAPTGPARQIRISGRFDSDNRRRLGLDLLPWLEGPVDIEARLATVGGNGSLDVQARLDDAKIETGLGRLAKPAGAPGHADARLTVERDVVTRAERLALEAGPASVTGTATRGNGWDDIRLDADIAGGAPNAERGHCAVTIERQPSGHRFRLTSEDAGALLAAIGGGDGLRDGSLVLTGTVEPAATGTEVAATLHVRDTVLVRSPMLGRVVALASLSGIESALARNGVPFDRLGATLRYRDPTLSIVDGVADGPSLTLAVDGTIDPRAATADLQGTVIPSYYGLNTAPGRIPVVKNLIGRGDEKGIQAIDFTASGPLAEPRVQVKPMSAIAPGVLRDVLRKLRR